VLIRKRSVAVRWGGAFGCPRGTNRSSPPQRVAPFSLDRAAELLPKPNTWGKENPPESFLPMGRSVLFDHLLLLSKPAAKNLSDRIEIDLTCWRGHFTPLFPPPGYPAGLRWDVRGKAHATTRNRPPRHWP